jgi:hypothetical protein
MPCFCTKGIIILKNPSVFCLNLLDLVFHKNLLSFKLGPTTNLPVKISGGARNTFTAEFSPREVGSHTINVDYNGLPVTGTPFTCKVYDAKKVYVSPIPAGVLRKNLQFTGTYKLYLYNIMLDL